LAVPEDKSPIAYSTAEYNKFKSYAVLIIARGTNEMNFVKELISFIAFGKKHGFMIEVLIENKIYPYETSPLVTLQDLSDCFIF